MSTIQGYLKIHFRQVKTPGHNYEILPRERCTPWFSVYFVYISANFISLFLLAAFVSWLPLMRFFRAEAASFLLNISNLTKSKYSHVWQ